MVRTRMAPSPTGNLHIGTAYATLWPYLFARSKKGQFILRIEDTDIARSTKEFETNIIEGLKWIGFDWDGEIKHQMDRLESYQESSQKLLDQDKAYYCFCTKEEQDEERKRQVELHQSQIYSGKCRKLTKEEIEKNLNEGKEYVVRLRVDENRGTIKYHDLIHGDISTESSLIGDIVIMRKTGIPLYNFAVVVDDVEMEISQVIRGDDHVSNTPKQILIYEALGSELPEFGHFPVILNQDRSGKLSKRRGSTSLDEFKGEGYLPEAMMNYIATLGWTPPGGQEILSKTELVEKFDLKDMGKAPAAWNQEKLDWMNGEYIRAMSDEELTGRLEEFLVDHPQKNRVAEVVPLIKERIKKLSDFVLLTDFLWEKPDYDRSVFEKLKLESPSAVLGKIVEVLESLETPWDKPEFEKRLQSLAKELEISNRDFFQLIRVAISGQLVTPPLFESIQILGEPEALKRIEYVKDNFENLPNLEEKISSA